MRRRYVNVFLVILTICLNIDAFLNSINRRHSHLNSIALYNVRSSCSGYDVTPWSREKVISEAAKVYSVDDVRYDIIINGATEKSYTGKFMNGERYNHKEEGVYVGGNTLQRNYNNSPNHFHIAIGELPLFWSKHKYVRYNSYIYIYISINMIVTRINSGTGWPSFYDVFDRDHIIEIIDPNLKGYTEIRCALTSIHIGHVFVDHPPPALERQLYNDGIVYERFQFVRYCCNAAALKFVPMSEFIMKH